jgi:hypothetical protein
MEILVILLVVWGVLGFIGAYVADQKGRSGGEGFLLSILLGPIGILIEAVLPTIQKPQSRPSAPAPSQADTDEAVRRFAEKMRLLKEADREAFLDRVRARKEAARQRRDARDAAYVARGITPGPLAGIESISLYMANWYKGSSDLMQMFVWAVCLSIPAATLAVFLFRPR